MLLSSVRSLAPLTVRRLSRSVATTGSDPFGDAEVVAVAHAGDGFQGAVLAALVDGIGPRGTRDARREQAALLGRHQRGLLGLGAQGLLDRVGLDRDLGVADAVVLAADDADRHGGSVGC